MDPDPRKEDLEIVARVRSGERDAYAHLVRKYQARITALCRTLVGQADAEDAAQEAFFKAYQALGRFEGNASFYTWLYRIASNHCLSALRSRKPSESLDRIVEEEKEGLLRLFGDDPRGAIESRELLERLLGALKPNYRLALSLRERDGLSYEEIAEVMETTVDSVKALLRRARAEVEEKLRHFLPPAGV
jgi:RNA polymerase sigma-70 factor (ECF subfamily)